MDLEKLRALQGNDEFIQKMKAVSDITEARMLFESYGISITEDEITQALNMTENELSEDDLDEVAGGDIIVGALLCVAAFLGFAGFVNGFTAKDRKENKK